MQVAIMNNTHLSAAKTHIPTTSFLRITNVVILVSLASISQSTPANSSTASAVETPDLEGASPLVSAAVSGDLETLRDLIEKGADLNGCDTQGNFPLYAAVIGDSAEVVELLIKRGANVHQAKAANVLPVSDRNATALHAACVIGNQRVVELLINAGADVNAFANVYEETVRKLKSVDLTHLTPETRAKIQAKLQMEIGTTPLMQAAQFGYTNIVTLLLEHSADVNFQKPGTKTALIEAAAAGHRDVIELLLRRGADLNQKGPDGAALAYSLINEQYDSAKYLMAAGAAFEVATTPPDTSIQLFGWGATQRFASGVYQTLIGDTLTAESRSAEAKAHYTEALASLTAARDALTKDAEQAGKFANDQDKFANDQDKFANDQDKFAGWAGKNPLVKLTDRYESWIPIVNVVAGAAGAALTDRSHGLAQIQMAQITALKASKTASQYFSNFEKLKRLNLPNSSPMESHDSHIPDSRSHKGHGIAQTSREIAQTSREIAQTSREIAQKSRGEAQSCSRKAATCDYLIGKVAKILTPLPDPVSTH